MYNLRSTTAVWWPNLRQKSSTGSCWRDSVNRVANTAIDNNLGALRRLIRSTAMIEKRR